MLAIPNLEKKVASFLLLAGVTLLVSCATHKDTQLVSDPDQKPESAVPWNKQEKWESQGGAAMGGIDNPTDRR
ncbi:MAG: hypothetical protein QOE73_1746 [Verrucomicrobiota bacterium]|jgi:hypothetical protein